MPNEKAKKSQSSSASQEANAELNDEELAKVAGGIGMVAEVPPPINDQPPPINDTLVSPRNPPVGFPPASGCTNPSQLAEGQPNSRER